MVMVQLLIMGLIFATIFVTTAGLYAVIMWYMCFRYNMNTCGWPVAKQTTSAHDNVTL